MGNVVQLVTVRQPECLNDFALQPTSRYKLESILDRTLPLPEHGICGVILYGLYGTGSNDTSMAQHVEDVAKMFLEIDQTVCCRGKG